ncbi:CsbD family protein [Marinitenerispora sediminis]|uniref:CsbD family protein n=1 Tax=Marinitenerispora sediminis TaxID=1931232 RepID=A0A368SYR8_9ACTN|nr:CsbD family protein [Marinitenerispora sediminis]RCV49554.1 CsbD family protein [Marinitenerispora sediminis]RCV51814.1 CsbD family protein [Marinitenerispora sediminis]RCV54163.1 CsbD family protein [Marinitenerispora sediminis]
MKIRDRAVHTAHEVKGKVKEAAGRATHNERLVAEGKAEQARGAVEQRGQRIRDAVAKRYDTWKRGWRSR